MKRQREMRSKYRITSEKVKAGLEKGQKSGFASTTINLPDGIDWFKPEYLGKDKSGKPKTTAIYYLNVIPFVAGRFNQEAEEGDLWYRAKYRRGRVGNEQVVSPSSFGESCPMFALYKKMKDDPNIPDAVTKEMGTKQRELYYVQDVKEEGSPVRLLDFAPFIFGDKLDKEMLSEEYEDDEQFGFDPTIFSDPVDGCTLKIVFEQKQFGTRDYSDVSKVSFIKRMGEEVTDELIESLSDPMSLLIRKSPAEIQKMMDSFSTNESTESASSVEITVSELEGYDRSALKIFIRENGLDIKPTKSMSDDDLRDAIKELVDLKEEEELEEDEELEEWEEEVEEEEEEVPAPSKYSIKKPMVSKTKRPVPAKKEVDEDEGDIPFEFDD